MRRVSYAEPAKRKPSPGGFFVDSYRSIFATWRAGHAAAPTFINDASRRPYKAERGFSQKISASRVSAGACVFRLLPDFGRMSPFPGNFLSPFPGMTMEDSWGGRKRSPSETQFILPIAVIHGHARKVPIIRDVAVAHTVSLIDQKDTCN